jgi:hypothetical protein
VSIRGTSIQSLNSTDQFAVPAPTITPGTIRSTTSSPSTFYTSATSLGEEIIFNGTNFGTWSSSNTAYWSVTYGPTGIEYKCSIIQSKCNDNEVHCSTLSTATLLVLSGLVFRVTVFGRSVTGTDVYNYPETPVITLIRGCTDTSELQWYPIPNQWHLWMSNSRRVRY